MGKLITAFARRRRAVGGFYFAPGYNPSSGLSELWTTDGVTCTKVWEDPTGGNLGISHLAHATATGQLYIFCDDYSAPGGFRVSVYRLDPATNAATPFAGPYQLADPTISGSKPAAHAAEYRGALYVAHQGGHDTPGAYVARVDLGTGAVGLVALSPTSGLASAFGAGEFQPDFTGGMGVRGDILYWTDGVAVWSGGGGTLALAYPLWYDDPTFGGPPRFDADGMGACGSPVSNPLDGEWYFPGQYAGDEIAGVYGYADGKGIARMIRTSGDGVEFNPATPVGQAFCNRTTCLTVLYDVDDVTPLGLYALDDGQRSFTADPNNLYVWARVGGVWSAEIDLHALNPHLRGCSCAMKSSKGELYVLGTTYFPGAAGTQLYKRTTGGAWALFRDFPGYGAEQLSPGPSFCPVARVSAVVKCHEM